MGGSESVNCCTAAVHVAVEGVPAIQEMQRQCTCVLCIYNPVIS